jgi:hypothetical protein
MTKQSSFDPWQRQRIFPLASVSRPALGPTQPPVQWVPGVLSPEVKHGQDVTLTTHPHLVPRSWMSRSYTFSPPPPPCLHRGVVGLLYRYIHRWAARHDCNGSSWQFLSAASIPPCVTYETTMPCDKIFFYWNELYVESFHYKSNKIRPVDACGLHRYCVWDSDFKSTEYLPECIKTQNIWPNDMKTIPLDKTIHRIGLSNRHGH